MFMCVFANSLHSPPPKLPQHFFIVLICFVLKIEEALRERVVGQNHVVEAVSDAVRISRAGLQAPNCPVASFFFLGPGVGKVSSCPSFFSRSELPCLTLVHFLLIDGALQSPEIILV